MLFILNLLRDYHSEHILFDKISLFFFQFNKFWTVVIEILECCSFLYLDHQRSQMFTHFVCFSFFFFQWENFFYSKKKNSEKDNPRRLFLFRSSNKILINSDQKKSNTLTTVKYILINTRINSNNWTLIFFFHKYPLDICYNILFPRSL